MALPNLPQVDVEELSTLLREAVGVRVVVDNDANLHGLGELAQTTTRPDMRMLTMTVGTGLGSSPCAGDHLARGGVGTWPEMGHVPVTIHDRAPRPCGCGATRNHLESFISSRGLVTSAKEDGCKRSMSTPEALFTAASADNVTVIESLLASDEIFGRGLALAVDALGVSDIVIGGGCAPLFPWLEPGIRQGLEDYAAFPTVSAKVQIRKSEAKSPALIGAAALVMSVD